MSRSYKARQKVRRQQARAAAKPVRRRDPSRSWHLVILGPVLAIAAILAVVAVVGFGASNDASQKRVDQKVTELLAGIPQHGPTLGSPKAPISIQIFADLECPTVKRFVVAYLPSIVRKWVRDGDVKLEYRSLETDTFDEHMFFQQEVAALAAGRQNKMWNFALTFFHEQKEASSRYATDQFLTDIASQVPGLKQAQWRQEREGALLSDRIVLDGQSAAARGFRFTPSFVIDSNDGHANGSHTTHVERRVGVFLGKAVEVLSKEATEQALKDAPGLDLANLGEKQ